MKHEVASARLLELAYGELAPREARAVEEHAAGCDACRAELAGIRETRALLGRLPVEPAPERGEGIVFAAARQAAEGRRPRPLLPRWLWAGTASAMAAAVVAVVSWQLARTSPVAPREAHETDLLGRAAAPAAPPAERPSAGDVAKEEEVARPEPPRAAEKPPATGRRSPERSEPAAIPAKRAAPVERRASRPETPGGLGAGKAEAAADRAVGRGGWAPPEPAPAAASPFAPAPPRPPPPAATAPPRDEAAPSAARAPAVAPQVGGSAASAESKAAAPARRRAAAVAEQLDERAEVDLEAGDDAGGVETRSFDGCRGELRRVVERDGDGRVIRYVRQGGLRTVEHRYGADGRLRAAFVVEGGVRRAVPLDAPGLVRDARDAGIDAPPRCSAP